MKVCSHCNTNKKNSEFRKRREFRKRGGGPLIYLNNTCKSCDALIANKYYFHHKDDPDFKKKWIEKSRQYYQGNAKTISKKMKVKRQSPKYKAMMKAYREKNKKKIQEQERVTKKRWQVFQRDNVTDAYCIALIRSQNGGKSKCNITPEMIEQKRLQILIKRKLYEIRKADPSRSHERPNSVLSGADIYRHNTSEYANNY